jgi:hypothetical protein
VLSDVSGMSFSVAEDETIYAEISGFHTSSATGSGIKIAFTGPASPVHVRYSIMRYTTLALSRTMEPATAFGVTLMETNGFLGSVFFSVVLTLKNGANAGPVQFQAASETNLLSMTITRGATMRVFRIP